MVKVPENYATTARHPDNKAILDRIAAEIMGKGVNPSVKV